LEHPPGYIQAVENTPYTTAGGSVGVHEGSGVEEDGMRATAWGMLNKAGEAFKNGEEAVWRAIKGK